MASLANSSIENLVMDLSDEDPFAMSDEEEITPQFSTTRNPIEENLLKQIHETTERVEKARSSVDQVQALTEKILKNFDLKAICGESGESDTDSDLYQVTGEPVVKKKRTKRVAPPRQPLEIEQVWQQIIDDKWIVGILLKNRSNRILEDPCVYIIVKDQPVDGEIVTFWEIVDSMSARTNELGPNVDKLVATIALDLPNFENNNYFEAYGTISYLLDDKHLQTPIPNFHLRANDVADKIFAPKFNMHKEKTVLGIKSICVERKLIITLDKEDGRVAARLFAFLEENGFTNLDDDVYIAKNNEFFRHCIFEILPCTEIEAPVRISAKSPSHLELIVRLLRDKFPDIKSEIEFRTLEAARALERELLLALSPDDIGELAEARMVTDLLLP